MVAGLGAVATAVPPSRDFQKFWSLAKRQNDDAAALGLTDTDILQLYVHLSGWLARQKSIRFWQSQG